MKKNFCTLKKICRRLHGFLLVAITSILFIYLFSLHDSNADIAHARKQVLGSEILAEKREFVFESTKNVATVNDKPPTKIKELTYWEKQIKRKKFPTEPPNKNFILHNKLPKSGSTTMNLILLALIRTYHSFNFTKIPSRIASMGNTIDFLNSLELPTKGPTLILKHHVYVDFESYNLEQPTYINVMRHPLEWFASRYYFERNGWKYKPGARIKSYNKVSLEDANMTIEECISTQHHECMENTWNYIEFFCGEAEECSNFTTNEQKSNAVDIAKNNILNNYFIVGILEQFEDTLTVFERLLPTYFKGAPETWSTSFLQGKRDMTRTINKKEMTESSKDYFRNGPLRYEIELYDFARKIFNERMKQLKITSVNI